MRFFGLFALCVVFGINLLVYFYFTRTLNIEGKLKVIFLILIMLFGFSYFFVRFFSRSNSLISYILSYFTSLRIGVLFALLLFISISLIIILILRLCNVSLDLKYIAYSVIACSILYVSYGLWNANNPRIVEHTIKIEGISDTLKNKKVIFFADSHFGSILQEKFLSRIISMINSENPDIILISGDLFDGTDNNLSYFKNKINNLKSKEGIFFVRGNHDSYFGGTSINELISGTNITLLDDEYVIIDGLQIAGLDYYRKGNIERFNESLLKLERNGFDSSKPNIMLTHEPAFSDELKNYGIDLQLSGHTHGGAQMWPLRIFTYLIYDGKDRGLYTDGNYNIFTTVGLGTWGPPIRVGTIPEIVVLKFE